jgi:hypothetical protein
MQVADLKRKKKRRRMNRSKGNADTKIQSLSERRKDNDPLQSFGEELDDLGVEGVTGDDDFDDPMVDEPVSTGRQSIDDESKSKVVLNTKDGTGRSTSGRNAWKEKRRKGKFKNRSSSQTKQGKMK